MNKSYGIKKVTKKDNGAIDKLITRSGVAKTKKQVINDINKGANVFAVDKHKHKVDIVSVDNKYVKTVPNKKKCDNLSELDK